VVGKSPWPMPPGGWKRFGRIRSPDLAVVRLFPSQRVCRPPPSVISEALVRLGMGDLPWAAPTALSAPVTLGIVSSLPHRNIKQPGLLPTSVST